MLTELSSPDSVAADGRVGPAPPDAPDAPYAPLLALAAQLCAAPVAALLEVDGAASRVLVAWGTLPELPPAWLADTLALADAGPLEITGLAGALQGFYAGLPVQLADGSRPALLCVLAPAPKRLTPAQRQALQQLAQLAASLLEQQAGLRCAQVERDQAEQRFRVLAELVPLGVYSTDAQGRSLHVNSAWQRIYGLDDEHSLGEGWSGTLHPKDADSVREAWMRAAAESRAFEMSYRIQRPAAAGGDVRQVLSRARPLQAADGRLLGYVGMVDDLTERLAAERALRDSQDLLDRTGRVAGVGGWSLDLRTQELVWSDQTCRIHDRPAGYRPSLDEALGYYRGEDARAAVAAAVRRGMALGQAWSLELPLVTATGREIWVLAQGQADWEGGQPVRLVGALQDVTAHHRAAIELELSRERLRRLYEATPALMHSVDREGRVLNVSNRWLERLGYARHQVIGRPLDAFMTPESARRVREVFRPRLWLDGYTNDCPAQLVCADGSLRDMLASAVIDPGSDGMPARALCLMDDITDDLRQRAELAHEQQLRRQIEQHARELDELLRERSEMLDVLAHEVRQPLNNASAALQSAAANLAGRGERQAQDRLTRAQAVLGQVLAGVDNTLAAASLLAGGGRVERLDTDIDTLIAVSIADLSRDQRDRIVVKRHTATRTAQMDMSLMRLALRNLLSNALRYSSGFSPVTLHVMDVDEPLALRFEVADAGPGIPRELQARLFTRGARGGGQESTHGLGLYIVRRVMELHDGSAELVRTGPLGTVMRLTLPLGG